MVEMEKEDDYNDTNDAHKQDSHLLVVGNHKRRRKIAIMMLKGGGWKMMIFLRDVNFGRLYMLEELKR